MQLASLRYFTAEGDATSCRLFGISRGREWCHRHVTFSKLPEASMSRGSYWLESLSSRWGSCVALVATRRHTKSSDRGQQTCLNAAPQLYTFFVWIQVQNALNLFFFVLSSSPQGIHCKHRSQCCAFNWGFHPTVLWICKLLVRLVNKEILVNTFIQVICSRYILSNTPVLLFCLQVNRFYIYLCFLVVISPWYHCPKSTRTRYG